MSDMHSEAREERLVAGAPSFPLVYWVGTGVMSEGDSMQFRGDNRPHLGATRVTRYELLYPDPRGDYGPRFLAIHELLDERALEHVARGDVITDARRAPSAPRSQADVRWSFVWRQILSLGESSAVPYAILLIGMDPAADSTNAEIDEFNAFYNEVHVPDVVEGNGFSCARRFELHSDLSDPPSDCPRYAALYEASEDATLRLETELRPRDAGAGPRVPRSRQLKSRVWQERNTKWRLVYRRLGP